MYTRLRTHTPLLLLPVLLLLPSLLRPCAVARAATEYEKALAYYETYIERPPLSHRNGAIRRLARTKDPRALERLAARYAKPRPPHPVHERYLIASAIGRFFTEREHVARLWELAHAYRKQDEHAWLWFNALGAAARQPDATRVVEAVLDPKLETFLRAAALEALAAQKHRQALSVVPALLAGKLPRSDAERSVLLESCAAVLLAHEEAARTPAFGAAATRVVDLLKDPDVPARTRLVIARYLSKVYRTRAVTVDHAFWRRVLQFDPQVAAEEPTVVGRPRFYGVEASGTRVAYLLDLSDSMLEPLTQHEITDARASEPAAQGRDEPLDWKKIRNRFDLARAYLKRSLRALPPKTEYLVVGFGDRAHYFNTKKSLARASRGKVAATIKELDEIEPGRRSADRPHGRLDGATNVYAALLHAFRALPKKSIKANEHVDPKGVSLGCDTIFLFSDGKPTKDDFASNDRFDGGRITVDREVGKTEERARGSASFGGPYRAAGSILEDVRRMNLFRKAEIHTVAMGEADNSFMRRMAEQGLGQYRSIGMLGRHGHINAWWVIGPYPTPKMEDWGRAEEPERGVDLESPLAIGEEAVRWKRVFAQPRTGILDLDRQFEPRNGVAAYGYAEIHLPSATDARLLVGSDDGVRVWLNDELIHTKFEKRGVPMKKRAVDEDKLDVIEVKLKAGANQLLVKVCDDKGPWRFCVRVQDAAGAPLPFLME